MKKKVVIASVLVVLVVIIIGICCLLVPRNKEITEEDYKENPKYILEEVIVSEDGTHFELPKVKKVWEYSCMGEQYYANGIVEISEKNYNSIIDQLENDLKIPRVEDSAYRDAYKLIRCTRTYAVDNTVYEGKPISEIKTGQIVRINSDVNVTYIIEPKDCKYQTEREGSMIMAIFMIKKYDKYYLAFERTPFSL